MFGDQKSFVRKNRVIVIIVGLFTFLTGSASLLSFFEINYTSLLAHTSQYWFAYILLLILFLSLALLAISIVYIILKININKSITKENKELKDQKSVQALVVEKLNNDLERIETAFKKESARLLRVNEDSIRFHQEDMQYLGEYIQSYYGEWLRVHKSINNEGIPDLDRLNSASGDVTALLEMIRAIISTSTGFDVSCNIKVWKNKLTIVAKWRSPSESESFLNNSHEQSSRTTDEFFHIFRDNQKNLNKLKKKAKLKCEEEAKKVVNEEKFNKIRYNSAYNKILLSNESDWIGNNLAEMTKKGTYFSNSDDYEDYYSSLAIFKMGDPSQGQTRNKVSGLLIFDMKEGHGAKFNAELLRPYGIFLAHSMNVILLDLQKLNQKIQIAKENSEKK